MLTPLHVEVDEAECLVELLRGVLDEGPLAVLTALDTSKSMRPGASLNFLGGVLDEGPLAVLTALDTLKMKVLMTSRARGGVAVTLLLVRFRLGPTRLNFKSCAETRRSA